MTKALVSASPSSLDVPRLVDDEELARRQLAPVRTERVEQEPPRVAGHGQAEVVVDGLVEAVEDGGTEGGGQLDPGPDDLAHAAALTRALTTRP